MPKPYPSEFRRDVIAVARQGGSIALIAKDFGITEPSLRNWLRQADSADGNRPGVTSAEAAKVRELRRRNRVLEQEVEILRRADYEWEDWAPAVARYYAIIAQMDNAIASVLRVIDEASVAEDTLVIYTTDHGGMGGSHRMMDKHYVMYDNVVGVPLIMRWPGRIASNSVVDAFAYNTLDMSPTISSITGIASPAEAHGALLFEASDGLLELSAERAAREQVVSTHNGQQFGLFTQRMIRNHTWKYVWNPTDVDELYDLVADLALPPFGGHGVMRLLEMPRSG